MKIFLRLVVLVVLVSAVSVPRARAEFAEADWEFLRQHCLMFKEELDMFPKLAPDTRARVTAWVAARDSRALIPFRDTRHYFYFLTKLRPGEALPFPRPPSVWNEAFLLPEEVTRYHQILAEHPPC